MADRPRVPTIGDAKGDKALHKYLLSLYRNAVDLGGAVVTGDSTTILDGTVAVFDGDGLGAACMYFAGNVTLCTTADGIEVRDSSGSNPIAKFTTDVGVELFRIGVDPSGEVRLTSTSSGAVVRIEGEDAGGTMRTIVDGHPDGATALYYTGSKKIETDSIGAVVQSATPNLLLKNDSTVEQGRISHDGSNMIVRSTVYGAGVTLDANNSTGALKNIVHGDPDAEVSLYYAGGDRFRSANNGVEVIDDVAPGLGTAHTSHISYIESNGTLIAALGFVGTADLYLASYNHGGKVQMRGEDAGGTMRTIVDGDPDGALSLYYAGLKALDTTAEGATIVDTSGSSPLLAFRSDAGTRMGYIQSSISGTFEIRSEEAGTQINLRGTNASSALKLTFVGDPNGAAKLHYAGNEALLTRNQGIQVKDATGADDPIIQLTDEANNVIAHLRSLNGTLTLSQFTNSGHVKLEADNATGTTNTLIDADPDGSAELYYAGNKTFETLSDGAGVRHGTGTNAKVRWYQSDGTEIMNIGAQGSNVEFKGLIDSTPFVFIADNSVGTATTMLTLHPDNGITLANLNLGFFGTAPSAKPTVSGSRGGNAALESLINALATLGLITDSTTA